MARWRNVRKYGFRSSARYFGKKYATRQNAIASLPYIGGAALSFAPLPIPAQANAVIMGIALAPPGLMRGRGLGTVKAVATGYAFGKLVQTFIGNPLAGTTSTSGGVQYL